MENLKVKERNEGMSLAGQFDFAFQSMQGVQVRSLTGRLESHLSCGKKTKHKTEILL